MSFKLCSSLYWDERPCHEKVSEYAMKIKGHLCASSVDGSSFNFYFGWMLETWILVFWKLNFIMLKFYFPFGHLLNLDVFRNSNNTYTPWQCKHLFNISLLLHHNAYHIIMPPSCAFLDLSYGINWHLGSQNIILKKMYAYDVLSCQTLGWSEKAGWMSNNLSNICINLSISLFINFYHIDCLFCFWPSLKFRCLKKMLMMHY